MGDASLPPVAAPVSEPWNPDLIFSILADPVRRHLLFSLAQGGARPASVLKAGAGRRLDATLKHLAQLCSARLLVTSPDPADGRRMLYALSPAVPLVKSVEGTTIDFSFCRLRL